MAKSAVKEMEVNISIRCFVLIFALILCGSHGQAKVAAVLMHIPEAIIL